MQSSNLISYLRGFVKIEVRGANVIEFINKAAAKRYNIWSVSRTGVNKAEMYILIKHFFRLRTLLKQTGCRVHVKERYGFPFFLDKLERRKFFIAGLFGFIIGLYVLSSIVWKVEVSGNDKIPTEDIMKAAMQQGIYALQWKFRLQDPDTLSKALESRLPGTAWVGVELKGTKVHIKVVESRIPDKKQLKNPRHLVSAADAVVTKMDVEKGKPIARPNMRVRKGDILVSGILGDEQYKQPVVAEGVVRGLVWHEYNITVPLVQKHKVYTGESKIRKYLVLGNRALKLTGYGKTGYDKYELIEQRKTLSWRNITLPVGWMNEKMMEVHYSERRLNENEARQIGVQQAEADILSKWGTDAVVMGEKILHEKVESGKVYMKALFEVDQIISKEQAIIPSEITGEEQKKH